MATMITSECINCGACEPECPNTAIYQGGVEWQALDGTTMHPALSNDIFYIVPEKCTECVGFYDHEACAAVCPVDCCVPNPDIPEAESLLLARARTIHPDKAIPDDAPSRFKKDGAAAAPAGAAPAAPAAAPKPAAAAPAAAPAAAAPAGAPVAPRPVVVRGRVEKPLAPAVEEASALVALARSLSRVLAVGHVERHNPAVQALLARTEPPLFIEGLRLAPFTPRSLDVDVVLDLMIHDLQIVSDLVRRPVVEIRAVGMPVVTSRIDIANARLEFEGGCVATLTASRVSPERMRKLS